MERNDRTRATPRGELTLTYRGSLSKKVKRVRGKGRSLTARKAETIREMVSGGFRLDSLLETACFSSLDLLLSVETTRWVRQR